MSEKEKRNLDNDLTEEQKKELSKLAGEIQKEAKMMVEDYAKNPSEMSGSVVHFHHKSKFLDKS